MLSWQSDRKKDIYSPNAQDKRLQQIKNLNSTNAMLSQRDYTYNAEGEIQTWTKNYTNLNLVQRFDLGYDNADQLLTAPLKNASTNALIKQYSYGYDVASNRTSELVGTVSTTSTPNNVNEITSQSGGKNRTLTYDLNGSITSDGGTRTFEWDGANRLVAINYTGLTTRSEFSYDGLNRVAKIVEKTGNTINSTRKIVWCGEEKCEFRDGNDAVTHQLYANGQYSGGLQYYYLRDHLGSIREMVKSGGTSVASRYDYDLYGRSTTILNTTPSDFTFTGLYRHSKSNLDLATYRAYDPDLGRWLSRDPIAEQGGLNLYRYVGNDSLNRVDPFGLRDVFVAIWNGRFPYIMGSGSVGHSAALEINGSVLLSQFPNPHGTDGTNITLDYLSTVIKEGRNPDLAYRVFVPDDADFDAAIKDYTTRRSWDYNPNRTETNCVDSVSGALQRGGVPVHSFFLPGPLGDELAELSRTNKSGQRWSVRPVNVAAIPFPF